MATNNRDLIEKIGEAIWGLDWKGPMSEEIEVALRTLRRRVNETGDVPDGWLVDLKPIIQKRVKELTDMMEKIPS